MDSGDAYDTWAAHEFRNSELWGKFVKAYATKIKTARPYWKFIIDTTLGIDDFLVRSAIFYFMLQATDDIENDEPLFLYEYVVKLSRSSGDQELWTSNRNREALEVMRTALVDYDAKEDTPCGDLLEAIYDFIRKTTSKSAATIKYEDDENVLGTVYSLDEKWRSPYWGDGLTAFKECLAYHDEQMNNKKTEDLWYGRVMAIIQSSGVGKSRMMNELSKESFMMSFTLRNPDDTGYPPGDFELTSWLQIGIKQDIFGKHLRMICFLAGIVTIAAKHVSDSQPKGVVQIAQDWHRNMQPKKPKEVGIFNKTASAAIGALRSDFKKKYVSDVIEEAEKLMRRISNDKKLLNYIEYQQWQFIETRDTFREYITEPLEKLVTSMQTANINVYLVVDEVSHLMDPGNENQSLLTILNRVCALNKPKPFWTLLLSTQSSLFILANAANADPSDRIAKGQKRAHPFSAFPMNIELKSHFKKPDFWCEPLDTVDRPEIMSFYGRPLWQVYLGIGQLRRSVAMKILGGGEPTFDPTNEKQVFALLASRLWLQTSTLTTEANDFARNQVLSHLRLVTCIDQTTGRTTTTTPNEPLVAAVSARLLDGHWATCIHTFRNKILHPGFVDAGTLGELITKLILIIAIDEARKKIQDRKDRFSFTGCVKLYDFLQTLFEENIWLKCKPTVDDCFKFANDNTDQIYVNFTSWSRIHHHFEEGVDYTGLHFLALHGQFALECHTSQSAIDMVIPIYKGDPKKPLDVEKISAMYIQLKNQKSRKSNFVANEVTMPWAPKGNSLAIQIELGMSTPGVTATTDGRFHKLQICGLGKGTFGFLKGMEDVEREVSMMMDDSLKATNFKASEAIIREYEYYLDDTHEEAINNMRQPGSDAYEPSKDHDRGDNDVEMDGMN